MAQQETATGFRLMNVVVKPGTRADATYQRHNARVEEIAEGFGPQPGRDLVFQGGKTLPSLTYTNFYLGGSGAWDQSDIGNIDRSLSAAMSDVGLNNMLAQYFHGRAPTTSFKSSDILDVEVPSEVFKDTLEAFVRDLDDAGKFAGFDLSTTVFNFLLPRGIVLSAGKSTGEEEVESEALAQTGRSALPADFEQEEDDSMNGLGGYHGSIRGAGNDTVYYAIGVFSEGDNGIVAFDEPWKNVVATFYHELIEARTDPDVEEANRQNDRRLVGWYSFAGRGEIGDLPMSEAGSHLSLIFKEIRASDGTTMPIQLQWSNAVDGPEGQVDQPRPEA